MSTPSPPPGDLAPTIKMDGDVPIKLDGVDGNVEGPQPPALPPRPPPRPRAPGPQDPREATGSSEEPNQGHHHAIAHRVLRRSCWLRKYVFLCTACGGLSVLLGALFLTVYFMLRSYTTSLNYFETIPTYVPATMLIVTGFMVMCLAGRRNRYSYLIKLCGGCCLSCAVLCVVVTVTTTVFHMNRLQSLRECVFTQKTQTCTCYSVLLDSQTSERGDEGLRYIFNSTPDCEVIHGALYSCLRAMFGLSVIGILVCIFSCMLVYQLLSHEKKKMYWEQLELRCRYLSRQQRSQHCACCDECRFPPPAHEMFPWELDDRYWTPRVGNLYSPNPGGPEAVTSRRSGWSWRRLPWSRSATTPTHNAPTVMPTEPTVGCVSNQRNLRHSTASPDSQYGFSSRPQPSPNLNAPVQTPAPNPPPTQTPPCPNAQAFSTESSQCFYLWGPPPPYTSPCRRQPLLNLLRQRSPQRVVHNCHQGRQCCPAKPVEHRPGQFVELNSSVAEPARVPGVELIKARCKEGERREERCVEPSCQRGVQCTEERCDGNFSREDTRALNYKDRIVNMFPIRVDHLPSMSSSSGELSNGKNCENYVNTSEGELMFEDSCSGDNTSGTGRENNTLPVRKSKKFLVGCSDGHLNSSVNRGLPIGQPRIQSRHDGCQISGERLSQMEGYEGLQECGIGQEQCCQRCQFQRERRDMHMDFDGVHRAQVGDGNRSHIEGDIAGSNLSCPPNIQMSPRIKYLARLEGIANQAFENQECRQSSSKNEPTESEVYFADVSSCCNVSVKNDGHDSSIYDEALDPQSQSFSKLHEHGPHPVPRRYTHNDSVPVQVTHNHPPNSPGKDPVHRPPYEEDFSPQNVHKHSPVRMLQEGVHRLNYKDDVPLRNIHPHIHRPLQEATPLPPSHRPHYGEDIPQLPHHRLLRDIPHRLPFIEDKHKHAQEMLSQPNVYPDPRAVNPGHFRNPENRGHHISLEENDSEDETLLQSHCFSYQRFAKSQNPGYLLRSEQDRIRMLEELSLRGSVGGQVRGLPQLNNQDESGQRVIIGDGYQIPGEEMEMECSSNSATPLSENTDSTFMSPMTPHFANDGNAPFYGMEMEPEVIGSPQGVQTCNHNQGNANTPYEQTGSPKIFHQHQSIRDNSFENNEFLAPDAQYETIPPQTPQKPRPAKRSDDMNGNVEPVGGVGECPTPQRRRLNLNVNATTSPSVREILSNFESAAHQRGGEATTRGPRDFEGGGNLSTDEDVQQVQSDATMDSGCHSDEFTSRRHAARASLRGKEGTNANNPGRKEQQELNTSRSVNV